MSDQQDVYYDRAEFLAATAAPEYAQSARYRDDVAGKLQRSVAAGTITPMGERVTHGEGGSFHTRIARDTPEGMYSSLNPLPAADPSWAAAGQVMHGKCFEGPDALAAAMGAPQWDLDPTYRQAVRDKVERSIREGFLDTDLTARDPSQRFTRG